MQVEMLSWGKEAGWNKQPLMPAAQLVLYFGGQGLLDSGDRYRELKAFYPDAHLLGCSTGGEIMGADVRDDSLVATAVLLEHTTLRSARAHVLDNQDSFAAGAALAKALDTQGLRYVLLLCDGTHTNGSELLRGLYSVLDEKILVTGGLAGDAADFKKTLVGINAPPEQKQVAAVGFYGDSFHVGYGSVGGWNAFGPQRKITKSRDNILYELDGRLALDLYKEYLAEDAARLPASALLFPLSIQPAPDSEHYIVRTVVGVDEAEKTMIFCGDMPEGNTAQLMRASFDELVDGATKAATLATDGWEEQQSLAILVSCIGRKLVMGQATADETEAVADVFDHKIPTIGFYSYGEICHQEFTGKCSLHNQTMTITVLYEQ